MFTKQVRVIISVKEKPKKKSPLRPIMLLLLLAVFLLLFGFRASSFVLLTLNGWDEGGLHEKVARVGK